MNSKEYICDTGQRGISAEPIPWKLVWIISNIKTIWVVKGHSPEPGLCKAMCTGVWTPTVYKRLFQRRQSCSMRWALIWKWGGFLLPSELSVHIGNWKWCNCYIKQKAARQRSRQAWTVFARGWKNNAACGLCEELVGLDGTLKRDCDSHCEWGFRGMDWDNFGLNWFIHALPANTDSCSYCCEAKLYETLAEVPPNEKL